MSKGDKPFVPKTPMDFQKLRLERLMANPDKPVIIPDMPKERKGFSVPEFVRNVMGSSAGAGSGEFHVYRHLRRKEYTRQKMIEEKGEKERLDAEFQKKLEENKRKMEERTEKKRAKRLKKKAKKSKQRGAKKPNPKEQDKSSTEESDDTQSDEQDAAESSSEPAAVEREDSSAPTEDPSASSSAAEKICSSNEESLS